MTASSADAINNSIAVADAIRHVRVTARGPLVSRYNRIRNVAGGEILASADPEPDQCRANISDVGTALIQRCTIGLFHTTLHSYICRTYAGVSLRAG